jgi:putative FmdB family regulatory protein
MDCLRKIMPVYTYQCESCGVRFDRYQKFSEQSLTWCPECGKRALRKVYSPVGIVFKGSGFYSTDNRSPSGGGVNGAKSSDKNSEGEKPSSETKATPAPSNPAPAPTGDSASKSTT